MNEMEKELAQLPTEIGLEDEKHAFTVKIDDGATHHVAAMKVAQELRKPFSKVNVVHDKMCANVQGVGIGPGNNSPTCIQQEDLYRKVNKLLVTTPYAGGISLRFWEFDLEKSTFTTKGSAVARGTGPPLTSQDVLDYKLISRQMCLRCANSSGASKYCLRLACAVHLVYVAKDGAYYARDEVVWNASTLQYELQHNVDHVLRTKVNTKRKHTNH